MQYKPIPDRIGDPLIVLAGLGSVVASRVQKRLARLGDLPRARFISTAFPRSDRSGLYSGRSTETLLRASAEFATRRRQEVGTLAPRSFYLVYFRARDEERLLKLFDFFALPVGIDAAVGSRINDDKAFRTVESVVRTLLGKTDETRLLHQEVVNRRNQTPLLLPPRNFLPKGSKANYEEILRAIRKREITCAQIPLARIKHNCIGKQKSKWCFKDSREIVFPPDGFLHPPARQLGEDAGLGEIRASLNSLFRFGFPIADGFHYDAQRVGRPFNAEEFECCKSGTICVSGSHVNVYPNDRIR